MTRSSLLLFFALAAGVRESAAGYTFRRSYDGPDDERAVGVVPMPDGGFLVVGTAEAVPDYRGVMLVRTDSFGQRLWTRAVPESTAEVRVHGFCARGPDTILAVGDVKSTRIDRDMYVAELDSNCGVRWTSVAGAVGFDDVATSACRARDGGWVVAGHTLEFGQPDIRLVVFDSAGGVGLVRVLRTGEADFAHAVVAAPGGGYAVAGSTGLPGSRYTAALLVQLDDTCGLVRTRTFGGPLWDEFRAAAMQPDSGLALVGFTASDSGGADVFLQTTDSTGQGVRARAYGDAQSDRGLAVAVLADGLVLAGESFGGSAGGGDAYTLRTDGSGQVCWERWDGGPGFDCISAVAALPDGGLVAAGQTWSDSTGFDVYLMRTDEWGTIPLPGSERPSFAPVVAVRPNPFAATLDVEARSGVNVRSADGRLVRALGPRAAWDGRDSGGRMLPGGVYFVEAVGAGGRGVAPVKVVKVGAAR